MTSHLLPDPGWIEALLAAMTKYPFASLALVVLLVGVLAVMVLGAYLKRRT